MTRLNLAVAADRDRADGIVALKEWRALTLSQLHRSTVSLCTRLFPELEPPEVEIGPMTAFSNALVVGEYHPAITQALVASGHGELVTIEPSRIRISGAMAAGRVGDLRGRTPGWQWAAVEGVLVHELVHHALAASGDSASHGFRFCRLANYVAMQLGLPPASQRDAGAWPYLVGPGPS